MFADFNLARRIEAAEASLSREIAEAALRRADERQGVFVRELAGGVAVCTGVDSPLTKVIGVGFEGPPSESEVDDVERAYFDRAAAVRVEIATLADPAWCAALTSRGYVLEGFENVLGLPLESAAVYAEVAGVEVAITTDAATWNDVVIDGFAHPDTGVVSAPPEDFPRDVLERIYDDMSASEAFARYLARVGGAAVGGACLRMSHGIAQLAGAATRVSYRRRGVQTALLNARLRDAAAAGCEMAVVTTQPGSKSQQNAARRGFSLLYIRAVLVKRPIRGR